MKRDLIKRGSMGNIPRIAITVLESENEPIVRNVDGDREKIEQPS